MAIDLEALAHLYEQQRKYEQARLLYERAQAIRKRVREPHYPACEHYGSLLGAMGHEAEPIQQEMQVEGTSPPS